MTSETSFEDIKENTEIWKSYKSCQDWIERDEGFLKEPKWMAEPTGNVKSPGVEEDPLISFFSTLYDASENVSPVILSTLLLNCIFYSLLSDVRHSVHTLCQKAIHILREQPKILDKYNFTEDKKKFIRICFELFDAGTNLYHDARKIRRKREEIPYNELESNRLCDVVKIVANYLDLYAQSRRSLPHNELIRNYPADEEEPSPYMLGGCFNIKLKMADDSKSHLCLPNEEELRAIQNLARSSAPSNRFNRGYYLLLLARYYLQKGRFTKAKEKADAALYETVAYAEKCGQRIQDINNIRNELHKSLSWDKKFGRMKAIIESFKSLEKKIFALMAWPVAAIAVPVSIITLAGPYISSSNELTWPSLTLVIVLGVMVIGGLLGSVLIILNFPGIHTKYINSRNKKNSRGRNG